MTHREDAPEALRVEDLVVQYGTVTAVDGISFTLPRGQVLALLGRNGAGKTSTVEVCEGFRPPTAGRVRTLGLDPYAAHDELMPRVGIMLQSGGVYPAARAGEMLELLASFAARPLDVTMLIERLGLAPFINTPYRRLSGGEKQRLSLAMALVGRPELVFLDEPTAGMDAQSRRTTWELIEEIRADGVSVLLTTHLLDEAEQLADHVVIINAGRVVAEGSPADLTAARGGMEGLTIRIAPGQTPPSVAELTAALPDGVTVTDDGRGRYVLEGALDSVAVAEAVGWFARRRIEIVELGSRRRTLEDVFLDLTGGLTSGRNDESATASAVATEEVR